MYLYNYVCLSDYQCYYVISIPTSSKAIIESNDLLVIVILNVSLLIDFYSSIPTNKENSYMSS